jgi:hypothetical protein
MKTIIAGTRTIHDFKVVAVAIEASGFAITEVLCGEAAGVDTLGAVWARNREIPVRYFEPDWNAHGKAAGPIRNREMAEQADALILVWDGKSKGSRSMLAEAKKHGLKIYQHIIER